MIDGKMKGSLRFALCLLLPLLLLPSAAALSQSQWSNETKASTAGGAISSPPLVISDSYDYSYVFFVNNSSNAIYMTKFGPDAELVLGGALVAGSVGQITGPSAVFDSYRRINLVWSDSRDGNNEIYYALLSNAGAAIINATRLTTDSADSIQPKVSVDGTAIHVIWSDNRSGAYQIYRKKLEIVPPNITLVNPLNNSVVGTATPDLNATFSENVKTAWYSLDGNQSPYYNSTDRLDSQLLLSSEGIHNLSIYCNDSLGSVSELHSTFSYQTGPPDPDPPVITISSPIVATYGDASIAFDWAANENLSLSKYSLDGGANITITGNATLTLPHGQHNLTLYAWDGWLNLGTASVSFFVDINAPNVTVVSPLNNSNISTADNIISGTISDDTGITFAIVQLNGATVASWAAGGSFSRNVTYLHNQWNNVTVTASDTFSRISSRELSVYVHVPSSSIEENVTAGNTTVINETLNETGIILQIEPSGSGTLIVNANASGNVSWLLPYENNSEFSVYALAQGQESIGKFVSVDISGNATVSSVVLKVHYDISELDNNLDGDAVDAEDISETTLRLFRYCPSSGTWSVIPASGTLTCGNDTITVFGSGVDTVNRFVWANLSHMSTYGLAGTEITGGGGNTGGTTGGGSNTGGGAAAGGGTIISARYRSENVTFGNSTCEIRIKRETKSSESFSILTTTISNLGGPACTPMDLAFSDTVPPEFSAIENVSFSPPYSLREGKTVTFYFPDFSVGEARAMTYSVAKWAIPSTSNLFVPAFVATARAPNKPQPAPVPKPIIELPVINITLPNITLPGIPLFPSAPNPAEMNETAEQGALPAGIALSSIVGLMLIVAAVIVAVFYFMRKKRRGLEGI